MTVAEFFAGRPESRDIYEQVQHLVAGVGASTLHVSTSQLAFRRRRTFAALWVPGQYLHGKSAPLVLTIFLRHREPSVRWKEVVEPSPGRFTHHLELASPGEVDAEVKRLLQLAWSEAG